MASGLTPTYLLPYPIQTDAVDVVADVESLADAVETALLAKSPLASPTFTGVPAAPTAGSDTSTTQIATTQFVVNQGYLKSATASTTYAPLASPAFTGNPTAATQTLGNSSTRIATTAFVANELANFVTLPAQSAPTNGQFLFSNGADAAWGNIEIEDVTDLENTIDGFSSVFSPLNITISNKTADYTLAAGDSARQIEMNSSSANTLYVPTDASLGGDNFPIGTSIIIVQTGTGQTTITATTPGTTTINGTPGFKLRTRWSTATLIKRAANVWLVFGDLTA
jgi:hypothetical protein